MAFRKYPVEDGVFSAAVGLIVPLALLVLYHAALFVEPLLGDDAEQMTHPIGFHPQRHVERRFRNVLKIIRPVEPGGAVDAGRADPLERFEPFVVVVFAAVEHQVFEQVRKTRLARFLVLRADVIPDVDGNDRCLAVLVDDEPQPVVQRVFGEFDVDVGRGDRERRRDREQHRCRALHELVIENHVVRCPFSVC